MLRVATTILRAVALLGGAVACAGLVPHEANVPAPDSWEPGATSTTSVAGTRLYVGFYDDKNHVLLELANETHPDFSGVNAASVSLTRATLKLVPDEVMQQLMAELEAIGFDTYARPGLAPEQPLRGWVTIQRDDDVRSALFANGSLPKEQWETFVKLKIAVASYYQRTGGLRLIENPAGAKIFRGGR